MGFWLLGFARVGGARFARDFIKFVNQVLFWSSSNRGGCGVGVNELFDGSTQQERVGTADETVKDDILHVNHFDSGVNSSNLRHSI